MWDAVDNIPVDDFPLLIRIFGGGSSSHQTLHLQGAISRLNVDRKQCKVEVLNCDDVNTHHLSIRDVINWLLSSHIHICSAHLHQGIQREILASQGFNWDMKNIRSEIQRLKYHPGFPCGESLQCPVFLQDKFDYIKLLENCVNPTFKYVRPSNSIEMELSFKNLRRY